MDLLQTLGVSQQVVQDVQQAVNKSKPRVVEGKEHTLYVLKQKLDKANNHLAHVQEVLQKKEAEYLSALNRVEEQKALVTQLDKDYWEARRRLESLSDGEDETERQAVSVDEEDNDMSQDEDLLDNQYPEGWETVQPKKKGKKRGGGSTPPPPPPVQNPLNIQSDQQAVEAVNAWDLDCVNAMLKLCESEVTASPGRQQWYLLLNRERHTSAQSTGYHQPAEP